MWWLAEYEAVTLFSLKMSAATASGGKSLLVPTPYAVKMALLDTAYRLYGVKQAENFWPHIRSMDIALRPARWAVTTNLFQKMLRPRRNALPMDQPGAGPFQMTIGYREYVYLSSPFILGFSAPQEIPWMGALLININYLGKRGGFVQLRRPPQTADTLPDDFILLTIDIMAQPAFTLGTLQVLDDCTDRLTLEKADIYNSKQRVSMDKERITRNIILPYKVVKSSRSFTLYERIE